MLRKYKAIKDEVFKNIVPNIRLGPGSSVISKKTYLLSFLIKEFNLKTTLDLGVYYGGSLFPQAYAHKHYSGGIVYAVDPYTKENFTQYSEFLPLKSLNKYISETDFDDIYSSVQNSIKEFEFEKDICFVRMPSDEAAQHFADHGIMFDMIHIDGNHDSKNAMADVYNYLQLLKKGGFFIVDDAMFPSVKPACAYVKERIPEVYGNLFFTLYQNSETINEDIKKLLQEVE